MTLPNPSPFAVIAALALLLDVGPVSAQMTYTAGDLLVGFQATAGDGSGSTYVYNLGSGVGFRNQTSTGTIANLGTDLDAIFGPGWYARDNVYWGIAGVRDPAGAGPNTVVNGDPRATIYISKPTVTPGTSLPWDLPPDGGDPNKSSTVIATANSISGMQNGYLTTNGETTVTEANRRTPTAGSGGRGTIQSTGDINSWDDYNPINGAAFGGNLTGGVQGQLGTGTPLAHLDVYRLLGRANAAATPNTPVGDGLRVGTFSLSAAGVVTFAAPAVGGSAYDTWADSFTLVGADRAGTADPDKDGIANLVEFVIGGNPKTGDDSTLLPTVVPVAGGLVDFVFRRTDVSSYLNPRAEYDTDLIGTWTPAVNGVGGVVITTQDDGFAAGVDRVTVRIPATAPKQFVRLYVTQ